MTKLSSIMGFVGRSAATVVVLLAVAIAVVPTIIYTPLPTDLTLDFDKPTTMVVTGANSGLGLASVMHFAHNENATIIMACRSEIRCLNAKQQVLDTLGEAVVKAELRPMILDLSQKASIEVFAKELQGQPIHILMNNAGLAGATPDLTYHKEDNVENHIHVNHLGHVRLTHCLWKNLQLADQARIVVVSSLMAFPAANIPTFGWYKGSGERFDKGWNIRMYGCSKRANLFWANELHWRYKDDPESRNISVVAAHPGFTQTELCKNGCKGKNKLGRYLQNLGLLTGTIKNSAENGALSQSYAAVVPQAGVYLGPSLAIVGQPKIVGSIDNSWHHMPFARIESAYLWDKSMEALGIETFGDFGIPEDIKKEEVANDKEDTPPLKNEAEEVGNGEKNGTCEDGPPGSTHLGECEDS